MRSIMSGVLAPFIACSIVACSPSDAATPATEATQGRAQRAPSASRAVSPAEEAEEMRDVSNVLEFPQAFRGNWDYQREGCERDESTTAFSISEKIIKGYEGQETLLSIRQINDSEIRVTLHLETGSGEDTYEQLMILSPVEGISMRIETEDGESVRAYRCDPV